MHLGGNVSHDPTLEAADIAYAESLVTAATESTILGVANEFRQAAERNLQKATEKSGLTHRVTNADNPAGKFQALAAVP